MKIKNIETSYGKFPTMKHFEKYWEDKVAQSFGDGFKKGYRYFKLENLHKLNDVRLKKLKKGEQK